MTETEQAHPVTLHDERGDAMDVNDYTVWKRHFLINVKTIYNVKSEYKAGWWIRNPGINQLLVPEAEIFILTFWIGEKLRSPRRSRVNLLFSYTLSQPQPLQHHNLTIPWDRIELGKKSAITKSTSTMAPAGGRRARDVQFPHELGKVGRYE